MPLALVSRGRNGERGVTLASVPATGPVEVALAMATYVDESGSRALAHSGRTRRQDEIGLRAELTEAIVLGSARRSAAVSASHRLTSPDIA